MEQAGHGVTLVAGDPRLHKLTTNEDRYFLEGLMMSATSIRTGFGFDVHAFMADDNAALENGDIAHRKQLVLGGISIDSSVEGRGPLAGHSDADVVLHCITDAILGAIADGDIGSHFPPSDPQWRGASSDQFLAYAAGPRLSQKGGEIINIDATIICERPKIGPVRDAMRARIAEICGINIDQVSIKASTTERLGFTGRGEGIACQAVATVKVYEHVEPKTRTTVERLIAHLTAQSQTLATAESCTGGLLGASITHYAGTSAIYMGGINAYSNELKEAALSVPKDLMIAHGAVSTNVAQAMAEHLRDLSDADWGLGITGVAGPGGGTADKPVGMVCFAIVGKGGTQKVWTEQFAGSRGEVRDQAVEEAALGFLSLLDAPAP